MPLYRLVIAPTAKRDLQDIYHYSEKHWGKAQADSYLDSIKAQFLSLTTHPELGILRPNLLSGVRSLTISSHTLYYRISGNKVEIIRLLHGRQDPNRHLKQTEL